MVVTFFKPSAIKSLCVIVICFSKVCTCMFTPDLSKHFIRNILFDSFSRELVSQWFEEEGVECIAPECN